MLLLLVSLLSVVTFTPCIIFELLMIKFEGNSIKILSKYVQCRAMQNARSLYDYVQRPKSVNFANFVKIVIV